MKKFFSLLLLTLGLIFFNRSFCQAQEIGLLPAYPNIQDKESFSVFSFELEPGEQKQETLAVVNLTTEEQAVVLGVNDENRDWITLNQDELTIPPQQRKEIGFSLEIPAETEPGQYPIEIATNGASLPIDVLIGDDLTKRLEIANLSFYTQERKLYAALEVKNTGNLTVDSFVFKAKADNSLSLFKDRSWEFFWPQQKEILPGQNASFIFQSEQELPLATKFDQINWQLNCDQQEKRGSNPGLEMFIWPKLLLLSVSLISSILVIGYILFKNLKFLPSLVLKLPRVIKKKKKEVIIEETITETAPASRAPFSSQTEKEILLLEIRRVIREELSLQKH